MLTGRLTIFAWRWSVEPWQSLRHKYLLGVKLRANVCDHLFPDDLCIATTYQLGVLGYGHMVQMYLKSTQMGLKKSLENLAKIPPDPSVLELGSECPNKVPILVKTVLIGQSHVSALGFKAYLVIRPPNLGRLLDGRRLVQLGHKTPESLKAGFKSRYCSLDSHASTSRFVHLLLCP